MRVGKLDMVIKYPSEHLGKKCHVKGWNLGCVFFLRETDGKSHLLETPKTRRLFRTTNDLIYIRSDMERIQEQTQND